MEKTMELLLLLRFRIWGLKTIQDSGFAVWVHGSRFWVHRVGAQGMPGWALGAVRFPVLRTMDYSIYSPKGPRIQILGLWLPNTILFR